jgi:hypothetical protein
MNEEQAPDIPPELRAFIHSCIESIDQVELLLLMRGSERMRTARDIATELRIPVAAARRNVETLAARGLLEVRVSEEIAYRYGPKSDDLRRYCDLLAQYYLTARQSVIGFVAVGARLSIKRFSDAFRLRSPEES